MDLSVDRFGVESTARGAFDLGYNVVIATDEITATGPVDRSGVP